MKAARLLYLGVVSRQCCCLGFQFRSATDGDISTARKILFEEKMNPISLSRENLLVAFDDVLDEKPLLGFGQIRPLDENYAELASLYVLPERRKRGIGSGIIVELLRRHKESPSSQKVCLLTLKPNASLYEKFGFKIVLDNERKKLPTSLQFEFQAGNALSFFLGNDLICMAE